MPRIHPMQCQKDYTKMKRFCCYGILVGICVAASTYILFKFLIKNRSSNVTTETTIRSSITTFSTSTKMPVFINTTISKSSQSTMTMNYTSSNQTSYWIRDASLNTARTFHQSALLANGKVIVVNGAINANTVTLSCEFYSSLTGWQTGPSMKYARAYFTLTLFDNNTKLLATGGKDYVCQPYAEIYDSQTNIWTLTSSSMSFGRCAHTATLLGNGQILIAGGSSWTSPRYSSTELFTPSTNSFTNTSNMKQERSFFTSTLLNDNSTVLVTGGANNNGSALATAELYINNSWIFTTTNMKVRRIFHAAILLNDGNVLIAGGSTITIPSISMAEIYNPTTRTFTAVNSMKYQRTFFTLTLLPSGKVLAVGGIDSTTNTCPIVCEIYDPISKSWSDTAILNDGRYYHQTILLNDSVLVVGGYRADESTILGSSEKYYF